MTDADLSNLRQAGVRWIRLLYCDCAGLRKCRVVSIDSWPATLEHGISVCEGNSAATAFVDAIAPESGMSVSREARLMPVSTPVQLAWHKTHAMVCTELHTTPGAPDDVCHRSRLRQLVDTLAESNIDVLLGFETEFYLLSNQQHAQSAPELTAVDQSLYCQTYALNNVAQALDDMGSALQQCGIKVEQMHAESGHGQFEIATGPADPVAAADRLVMTREIIAGVAASHGMTACFLPKPFAGQSGSACHVHISLWRDGRNLFQDMRLPVGPGAPREAAAGTGASGELGESGLCEAFMAGLLKHLPALALWTLPSPLSGARVRPSTWSGAFRAWGVCNREAVLRVCLNPQATSALNVEYKAIDNCANPYLALAAILCAGKLGMRQRQLLPAPCEGDPAELGDEERARRGIHPLDASLASSLAAWDEDTELQEEMDSRLSSALLRCFVAVRRHENKLWTEQFDSLGKTWELHGYPTWLLKRY
ncbi:hypothetical protein WJX73_010397 [Symbiochloris irregularis]|uniref:GS catalytic domain-containing protein n=1 Tax=Symbiochloris irregularis TaxID=706552 RepID=A0AAW1P2C2_9CHLO